MNQLKDFNDIGKWRSFNPKRPWYLFALKLISNKKNEKILELGSGNGEFAFLLKNKNKEVFCIDISPVYIKKLIRAGFKTKKVNLNQKLPYKRSSFDGVVCLEVIEHVIQAEKLLNDIHRILKNNGWLIISTPNISWFGYRFLSLLGKVPFKEGYHLRYFNYHWLKYKLKQSGFKIQNEACFTPIPLFNRLKQYWLAVKIWPSLLAQDLVFRCIKYEK